MHMAYHLRRSPAITAAQADTTQADEGVIEEVVVTGDLNSLPGENVESILVSIIYLRNAAWRPTVSEELMDRMNMQDIDELITVSPGSFTQSFFGGGLDVRGTPGETYFRGIRRLDNPGNYPTPLVRRTASISSVGRPRQYGPSSRCI